MSYFNFFLNGQEYQIQNKLQVNDLLRYFNYKDQLFIIEYNKQIYNSKEWKKIYIDSNDKIEIITLVGGG